MDDTLNTDGLNQFLIKAILTVNLTSKIIQLMINSWTFILQSSKS